MKEDGVEPFGQLAGDWRIHAGYPGSSYILASPMGEAIKHALRFIPTIHPSLRLYQYALMPDHLHLILAAEGQLDEAIGRKIAIFKRNTSLLAGVSFPLFKRGFNDRIIGPSRNLDAVFKYLRENPWRLAVRRAHPDFFRRTNALSINGRTYQAYGNIHLLDNPFKEQVVVHRADTEDSRLRNRELWIYTAANGGVLVSPFISPAEKAVRSYAEELGGKIIVITATAFPERYKPAARDFALCEQGHLLIISLGLPAGTPLSRDLCLKMNHLASMIAGK